MYLNFFMKLLLFVDMHGSLNSLEEIKKKSGDADLIVCAGDITIFESDIEFFIAELAKLGKEVIIIHGNHEDQKTLESLCLLYDNIHFVHKKKKKIGDVLFIGYGGGGFSFKDKELENVGGKMSKWIKEHKKGKIIVVSHGPPYGTKLDKLNEDHVGNITLRKFIMQNKVDFLICGHLHENEYKKDMLKKTILINPGPNGMIIEV